MMTFSLLVWDPDTGELGAAAATGSYCVGGWVLRGRYDSGVSASQGAAPSTIWGDGVLDAMRAGKTATDALRETIAPDHNREWRQLAALDRQGGAAVHSGSSNSEWCGSIVQVGKVAAGNILAGQHVLDDMIAAYETAPGVMSDRLLASLVAAEAAGGDTRGLKSAALLVLGPDRPPLSLRVDMSSAPLNDLAELTGAVQDRTKSGNYVAWTDAVPVPSDPYRAEATLLTEVKP